MLNYVLISLITWATPMDWPAFRGPDGDGISQETGILQQWPEGGPSEVWRVPLGEAYAGITVVGARVFTMDSDEKKEYAVCLSADTGKQLWRTVVGAQFKNGTGSGPRAAPTIDGGLVYIQASNGVLAALNSQTGKISWQFDLVARFGSEVPMWGFCSSPLIQGDRLFTVIGGKEHVLGAFDKHTGKTLWTGFKDKAAYVTPLAVTLAGQPQIVFVTGNFVTGFSADGHELWQANWGKVDVKCAMPVLVGSDKIFVSASYDVGALMLRIVKKGDRFEAERVWEDRVMRNHFNASVVVDGFLYGFDNATLKCLNPEKGETLWARRRLGKGSLIYADGHLVVLGERGQLLLVEASPNGFVQKGMSQVLKGRTWTSPTLSGGKLYLRNQKEMVCLDLTGPAT